VGVVDAEEKEKENDYEREIVRIEKEKE